jgi:predicted TIM-barrel fold metal-dependent hydrolase
MHEDLTIEFDALGSEFIDAHVHLWTRDFCRRPLAPGWSQEQMTPPAFGPEHLLAHSRPAGVTRVVLIQMVFYGDDNSYMLDCMSNYPGVFAGVAVVDEHGVDPAGTMVHLHRNGVRGIRIVPPQPGDKQWLTGEGMRAMWATAARLSMAMCLLIDPEDLAAVERMCREFPTTRVVIDHCARLSLSSGDFDAKLARLCSLRSHPNIYIKLSAFYFLEPQGPPYRLVTPLLGRLVDAFGPDRLMWGSDCPFQVQPPHTYGDSLEAITTNLGRHSPSRDAILSGTAAKLFFDS